MKVQASILKFPPFLRQIRFFSWANLSRFATYSEISPKYQQYANADYQYITDFFYKKVQKYLVSSKKSSTFVPAFERDSVYILPFPLQVSA